jgi:hypothetical protein
MGANVAKLVNATTLEVVVLSGICGFDSRRSQSGEDSAPILYMISASLC